MSITFGQVLRAKDGVTNYVKLGQPRRKDGTLAEKRASEIFPITLADGTVLNEGDTLWLKDPRVEVQELVGANILDESTAAERLAAIQPFFRFKLQVNTISEAGKKGA